VDAHVQVLAVVAIVAGTVAVAGLRFDTEITRSGDTAWAMRAQLPSSSSLTSTWRTRPTEARTTDQGAASRQAKHTINYNRYCAAVIGPLRSWGCNASNVAARQRAQWPGPGPGT
jgi:hypothetical protein